MATKSKNYPKTGPAAPILERYPRVEIDRSFASESSRRNIDVIVWYKRLITAAFALIATSIFFTVVAVLFAFFQPLPSLYGSGLDGSLRKIDYVRAINDPRLGAMRSALTIEEVSRTEIGTKKTSAEKLPMAPKPAAPAAIAPAVVAPTVPNAPSAAPTSVAPNPTIK